MKKYFFSSNLITTPFLWDTATWKSSAAYQITTDEVAQSINHATCPEKNVSRNGNVN
jgi:hypothetical protein